MTARSGDPTGSQALGLRRIVVILAAGLVPWIVVPYDGGASLVFSFGLVNPSPFHLETVVAYVFADTGALPPSLLAWPTATLLYAMAAVSTSMAAFGREDRRITAGLFALAGVDVVYFTVGFAGPGRALAVPIGVVALWAAAWESRPDGWLRPVLSAG